jgi:MYXO-CTERM domain-containing protein
MKKLGFATLLLLPLLWASAAEADVMEGPCDYLNAGDPCQTLMNEDGVCTDNGGFLECVPGAATGGGQAGTGGGGSEGEGQTDENESSGCSIAALSGSSRAGLGFLALVALGAAGIARRRRSKR